MDKELAKCIASLRREAETSRTGFVVDFKPLVEDLRDVSKGLGSSKDVALACAVIFEEEDGLLSLVECLMHLKDREAQKGREYMLEFLADFVREIGEKSMPYARVIKERSLSIFARDESKSVQSACLTLLIALFELGLLKPETVDFTVDYQLVQLLLREFRRAKASNTLKSNILVLLGYLVEFFPQAFTQGNAAEVLKLCLDIAESIKTKDPAYVLLTGATKCLDSLLTWFDDDLPAGGSVENSKLIFGFLQQLLLVRDDLKRYEVVKAALHLLSRHAALFRLRLLEHGTTILAWLQAYCTHDNAGLRDAALLAFDGFITEVGSALASGDGRIHNPLQIYKSFMKDTLEILQSQDSHHKLVSVAIRALGKLSPAIVKYSGRESLKQAFHRLVPFARRAKDGQDGSLGYSITLIGSFADIIVELDDIEDSMVSFIAEITGSIFYQFPSLFPKQKKPVYLSLRRLLGALYSKGAIFTIFLSNIVWSSLERATDPREALAVEFGDQLWRHYVDLWAHVMDFDSVGLPLTYRTEQYKEEDAEEDVEEPVLSSIRDPGRNRNYVIELVFDTMMRSVIKLMMELNIKYRVRPTSIESQAGESEAAGGGYVEPEAEMDLVEPQDAIQMHKYLKLVEFTEDLLSRCNAPLFLKWTYTFSQCLIELSSHYPLISGFYKLLAVTISVADKEGFFSSSSALKYPAPPSDRQLCKELFQRYLQEVIVASRRYKLELLAACLRLCLTSPPELIGISSMVVPLRNALRIGLRYNPLAMVAIDALERLQLLRPREFEFYLHRIVPWLGDYLIEVESSSDDPDVAKQQGSSLKSTKSITAQSAKQRIEPEPFQKIQVRVQQFLGRIGRFAHYLVTGSNHLQIAGPGGLSWDSGDRVKYVLPFKDVKPDIWLDTLLPRVMELGLFSSDRRTKITACELLHALCLVMLGSAAKGPLQTRAANSERVPFDKIYRRVFPSILQLATDVDLVTRQIFQEFCKQLIHWLTSNVNKENPDAMALLDSILDGLVQAENGSLREFCANCFGEFLRWSVRHSPVEVDNFVNVTSMLRRIYNRLDHPNAYHRLGAAMAAQCMYPVLRQNNSIVGRHILEFTFYAVKSLRLAESDSEQIGTVKQLNRALGYLEKLIKLSLASLQEKNKHRLLFQTVDDFLGWLFLETGRPQEKCRLRCMHLFSSICLSLPGGSAASWFVLQDESRVKLDSFDVVERLPESFLAMSSLSQVKAWLGDLSRSWHWLTWALQGKLVGGERLQGMGTLAEIPKYLECMLSGQNDHVIMALTPAERDTHLRLKYSTVKYFLQFCLEVCKLELEVKKSVLSSESDMLSNGEPIIPTGDPNFHHFLALLFVKPRQLGVISLSVQSEDEVASTAVQLMGYGPPTMKSGVIDHLRQYMKRETWHLSLDAAAQTEESLADLKNLLKGLQLMHRARILSSSLDEAERQKIGEQLMLSVFEMERDCPPALEPVALDMLTVSRILGIRVQRLLELVFDDRIVQTQSDRKLTAGNIFYVNFRKIIIQQVKFAYKVSLPKILQSAVANVTSRMLLDALLDEVLKSSEDITKHSFLVEFVNQVGYLEPCCFQSSGLSEKQFFLEIIRKLMILDCQHNVVLGPPSSQFIVDAFFSFLNASHLKESESSSPERDSILTLKCDCLVLVPLFLSYSIGQDFGLQVARSLTGIVADYLLVGEKDIPPQSHQRTRYENILDRILRGISASKKLELLEVLFPILQYPTKVSANKVSEALHSFGTGIDGKQVDALSSCHGVMTDSRQPTSLRRAIATVVFPPLVRTCSPPQVVRWYAEHIQAFVHELGKQIGSINSVDAEKEEEYLIVRICYYNILELLFIHAEEPLIRDTITPVVPNNRLMKLANEDARAKNDPLEKNVPLWRDLHVAAYNCLAAIISRTQENEKFFSVFLFKEGGTLGSLWQHLVDCSKVYDNLPVETSSLEASFEAVRGLQSGRKHGTNGLESISGTLSSQYIIGSALSQEPAVIGTFLTENRREDGPEPSTAAAIRSEGEPGAPSNQVVIGTDSLNDDFDRHSSMGVVSRLIDHLHTKFDSHRSNREQMPEWMRALHSSLNSLATHSNVRLFLVKLVTKFSAVFAPYAAEWFRPFVMAIIRDPSKTGGTRFHYILREMCVCLLQWELPSPPDAVVGSNLVNHLMRVAVHESRPVLRGNISIIRLFMGTWKDYIHIDFAIVYDHIVAGGRSTNTNDKPNLIRKSAGLQLLGTIVACGLPPFDPQAACTEEDMYQALIVNLSSRSKDIYEASAELLGMAMKQRNETNSNRDGDVLESSLKRLLHSHFKSSDFERFLNILNKATLRFPFFLEQYVSMVIDLLPRLHGAYQTIALDILLRHPQCLRSLSSTIAPIFSHLLVHRDETAQLKGLDLLSQMLQDMRIELILEKVLPVLCATFSKHENADCRKKFYDVLVFLYDCKRMKNEQTVVHYLLWGLCDGADSIRYFVQSFWHSKLSSDLTQRFTELLSKMYDPVLEEQWAQYTDALLLQLCKESVDYTRPIFDAPLSDCEFHEQSINTSWQGGSLPMTPLFSATQLSLSSIERDGLPQSSERGGMQVVGKPGMIRATIAPSFSLSLSQIESPSPDSFETAGSSLFALSQTPTGQGEDSIAIVNSAANLKRVQHSSVVRASAIRGKQNADRRREARHHQQTLERSNKVHMMRQYRSGELPDIQIKNEDVIKLLAALAGRDTTFARLTFKILSRAVLSLPANQIQDTGQGLKAQLKLGIEAALAQTHHGISFVACLHSLCLEDPSIWIRPELVGCASSKSRNFHSGIMLLESQVCYDGGPAPVQNSKRHKGIVGQVSHSQPSVDEAWLELAHLYESVGEADIVLALYQKHIAKLNRTKHALEAQLEGDYSRALALYDTYLDQVDQLESHTDSTTALGGGRISTSEIDIWDRQRRTCLMELNNWQTLTQESIYEIGEEIDDQTVEKLWDSKLKEPHLGLFVRGAAKLTSFHSQLMKFVQKSLENPAREAFLLENFSIELLHLATASDQFDRARLYLTECYKIFTRNWTRLHPLAVGSRHLQVQQLQKIVEHEEFIEYLTRENQDELHQLLMKWKNRWPSAQMGGVEAWDDVVKRRLLFFNKIQGMLNKRVPDIAPRQSGLFLATQLDAERAHIYLEAAKGLTDIGAYTVAKGYMQEYQALKHAETGNDDHDYQSFKRLVKLQNLQADRTQRINVKEGVALREKVLQYIQHTAQRRGASIDPKWIIGLKLNEANILSQIGWSLLELLPRSKVNRSALNDGGSRLGSTFAVLNELIGKLADFGKSAGSAKCSVRNSAKAFYRLGAFCDELLKASKDLKWGDQVREVLREGSGGMGLPPASAYPRLIVGNLSKAVSLDSSSQGQQSVARLLFLVTQYPDTIQEFQSFAEDIPKWLFVAWIPQMLATMDEDVGAVFVKLLEDVARLYPRALYHQFQVSKGDFKSTGTRRTEKLALYLRDPTQEGFARAVEDLTFPEQRLQDGLSRIKYCLITGDRKKAQEVFCQVFEDSLDLQEMKKETRLSGEYNTKFAQSYSKQVLKAFGERGEKLLGMDEGGFTASTKDVVSNLQKAVQVLPAGNQSLASLSRWMAEFDQYGSLETLAQAHGMSRPDGVRGSHAVEVPGQYGGLQKPDPERHVKLVGFEQTVVTLSSKQRPKILTMRGSDEKEYKFVVKGGEDLRLDQRIQQLFEVINGILGRDSACSRRELLVPTFAVIPVSRRCGLLQFVEHTRVLQDVIKDGLTSKAVSSNGYQQNGDMLFQSLTKQYVDWITQKGRSQNLPACYANSYATLEYRDVAQEMAFLHSQMPSDALRQGMSKLSTSAEAYLSMRSQFARSLSVVSVCCYVAGVGDRHLGNMLIDMDRGSLIPIDFGYSFGTAVILLPVPELIPFRLTRQMLDYLRPLDAIALLRNDMVRAMSALHARREDVGAVLDIFVKEPLVDWQTEAARTATLRRGAAPADALQELGEGGQGSPSHAQQHVELKIEHAHRKLDLWNPAEITVAELRSSIHAGKPYMSALEGIVRGAPSRNIRARVIKERCESVQEQIDCLLDQATDPNVYGRTWVGWQPWI